MSETTPTAKSKAESPRGRLKYITARLKELKDEKARLSEERRTLLAAHRAEKGRPTEGGGARKGRGERRGRAESEDDAADS
ncbi:MAG: hypothetical protein KDK75_02650 [Alphaproteobacteria bacterium]|nr:hypothetical protein [Alphaproteobacteria bacterium]